MQGKGFFLILSDPAMNFAVAFPKKNAKSCTLHILMYLWCRTSEEGADGINRSLITLLVGL